jgi:hypothetical protein
VKLKVTSVNAEEKPPDAATEALIVQLPALVKDRTAVDEFTVQPVDPAD